MNTHRKSGAVVGLAVALTSRVDAQAGRAIGNYDWRNTEAWYGIGRACGSGDNLAGVADLSGGLLVVVHAGAYDKVSLLFEGHRLDYLVDVFRSECKRCRSESRYGENCCKATNDKFFHTE